MALLCEDGCGAGGGVSAIGQPEGQSMVPLVWVPRASCCPLAGYTTMLQRTVSQGY